MQTLLLLVAGVAAFVALIGVLVWAWQEITYLLRPHDPDPFEVSDYWRAGTHGD